MATLKETFQVVNNAVASYDYIDLANGLGYVTFYGFATTEETPTTDYHINSEAIGSSPVRIWHVNSSTDTDADFDSSPFNAPRTIKGDVYILFTHGAESSTGTMTHNATITLYHYDGTTETSLGAESCENVSVTGGSTDVKTRILKISVSQRRFNRGDILRVNVVSNPTYTAASGNAYAAFFHDPLNRDYSSFGLSVTAADNPTYFKIFVPFRIENT